MNNGSVELKSIRKDGNIIMYDYAISSELAKYFENEQLSVEYYVSIETVPDSILAVPFVCNLLPIIWLTDSTLYLDELDFVFFQNIDKIKDGYCEMYPGMNFSGNVVVKNLAENPIEGSKTAVFFSGGLDAMTTLLRHIDEKPDLLTLWGADIRTDDYEGWNNVIDNVKNTSEKFGLDYKWVKTNFRRFIKYSELNRLINIEKSNWWHEMQHGIGIICHAAPLVYIEGYKKVYIASSFNEKQKGHYTCASDPLIDNHVKVAHCVTIHDGYELTRQDKVKFVVNNIHGKNGVNLRVCYEESRGENCCRCEKCYRTILEIISEGGNPNKFGFKWDTMAKLRCRWDMKAKIILPEWNIRSYLIPIKQTFELNSSIIENYRDYRWFINMDFDHFNRFPLKRIRSMLRKVKHRVMR